MKVNLNRINQDYLFEVTNNNAHKVLLDNKSKIEGKVEGVSPMELLLMALAGCSSIDIITILKKQKINHKQKHSAIRPSSQKCLTRFGSDV